jgi:hypothetical protein
LEEPLPFDQLGNLAYNKLVREGRQVPFASSINFVVSLFFLLESHYYLYLPLVSLHIHIHGSAQRSRSKLLNSRWLWNCRRTKRAIQDCNTHKFITNLKCPLCNPSQSQNIVVIYIT